MNPYRCGSCGGEMEHDSDCLQRPAVITEQAGAEAAVLQDQQQPDEDNEESQ